MIHITIIQLPGVAATKTFARKGITDEVARRSKPRATRGRARSWVFGAMSNDDLKTVLDGGVVEVKFKSGRVERVGLG